MGTIVSSRVFQNGKVEPESAALSFGAFHFDAAVVFVDDPRYDAEPEAGSIASLARGEEGLEDSVQVLRGNAAPVSPTVTTTILDIAPLDCTVSESTVLTDRRPLPSIASAAFRARFSSA